MAIAITVPRLGWSMEEGTFAGWLKQPGDRVHKGDLIYTLEGDKSAQDVESFDEGILHVGPDAPRAGDVVRVGQLLGHLLAEGEAPASGAPEGPRVAVAAIATRADVPMSSPVERSSRIVATPRARRQARRLGVGLDSLTGTGRAGRIRARDVIAASDTTEATTPGGTLRPHSPARRLIARRLVEAHQAAAPVTLTTTADATNLVNLRAQFRRAGASQDAGPVPTYNDLILKLTALALRQHPTFNAWWTEAGLFLHDSIHLGLAIDTDAGLVSPVLRGVDRLGVRALAAASAELVARARAGRLAPTDLDGATFTVTSLGSLGIDMFTPIVVSPQVAILGIGQIRRQPVYDADDRLVPRDLLTLSLTFDHRAHDGAPAARFLRAVAEAIANPAERLIT